jgi:nitrate/nitrite transporter NarK
MSDQPAPEHKRESEPRPGSFVRWQERTIAQLSQAMNLLLTLAVGALGFSVSLLLNPLYIPACVEKAAFTVSLFALLVSVMAGIVATCLRVHDFRTTRAITRERQRGHTEELSCLREQAKKYGEWTWRLFYTQLYTFGAGVALLLLSFCLAFRHKLF